MPSRKALSGLLSILLFLLATGLASTAFADPTPGAADVKVAVLPFEVNTGPDLQYLKQSLPELLTDRLKAAGFQVVDAGAVRDAAARLGGVPDVARARQVAQSLGATHAVFGSFSQVGETLSVDAKLTDVTGATGVVPITVTKQGLINLLPAMDAVVQGVQVNALSKDVVADIAVEGTKVLDKDVILMRLATRKGETYNPKTINQDLKTIYDLGYFDDVRIKARDIPGGKQVVVQVKERPRIQAIGVTGSEKFSEDDIVAAIATKKGAVLNPKVLADDIRVVSEMYRKEGYYNVKITHQIESAGEGQTRLNFQVEEGKKLYVEKIRLEGAKSLDNAEIIAGLSVKEKGFLSWFTKSGVLKEDMLERDAAYIASYYGDRGFIDAKVGKPEVEVKEDRIEVVYRVEEGPRMKAGQVKFEGDLISDPGTLADVTKLDNMGKESDYFSRSVVREDIKNLASYYNNFGYAYAEVDVKTDIHQDAKSVDVTYVISKHQKVHIRRVVLEGNTKTRDNVILREMRLADGDQFSGEKLQRSTERLNKLNYFGDVDIEPVPTGDPDEMDLKVKVTDKPTGRIGGGVGYSSYDGVFFGGQVKEDNLFGKGYQIGFSGTVGGKSTSYVANFLNPRVDDSLWAAGGRLYATKNEYYDYTYDVMGGTGVVSHPLGEYTTAYGTYRLDFYDIKDVQSSADQEIIDQAGSHIASVISGIILRDTTDRLYNPTRGNITTLQVSMGGGVMGGTDEFVKYQADNSYYTRLFGDLVFHARGNFGLVHENFNGKDIPVVERFYLGGIDTIRGYSYRKVSPQDGTGHQSGGDKSFFTNLELVHPLNKDMGIYGVGFFDAGGAWNEGEMFFSQQKLVNGEAPPLGLYKAVGAGLRWISPFGPLRFEYGYGLDKLYESSRHKFEFSMGQQF